MNWGKRRFFATNFTDWHEWGKWETGNGGTADGVLQYFVAYAAPLDTKGHRV